jgi:uncharacterized membrane protein
MEFPMSKLIEKSTTSMSHLWAIGFDNMTRAEQVREEIANLAWGNGQAGRYFIVLDMAVVVRHSDGSFTLNREPLSNVGNIVACTAVGFLAGLVLAAPLAGAALGALLGSIGTTTAKNLSIPDDFIRDMETQMKPGTSTLFILDDAGDMDIILRKIRGLGGKVLRTNVDREQVELVQLLLQSSADERDKKAQ